jgi:hypothetical protein
MNIYRISSHWNASTSRLHRKKVSSLAQARGMLGGIWVPIDGEYSRQWAVYANRADAHADRYGEAPHRAIAAVYMLSPTDQAQE